ncbi:MAG: hypothetical protein QOF98_3087, partial [Streptomyces sp.]|nr:hypothetical protein [Streptomyces sp.]
MTPWLGGRRRRAAAEPAAETGTPVQAPATTHAVEVADVDGVLVLRAGGSALLDSAAVFELARTLRRPPPPGSPGADGPDGIVTVLVVVDSGLAWGRLAELLDSLREKDVRGIRLVMSGAGADRPDQPAVARRIADAWEMEVIAPDGTVLLVPGGSLFVPGALQDSGWWRFSPDAEPVPLGPRHPVPQWQSALGRLPARTVGGIAVDRIPAGVLLRPADTAPPAPGDLCYAVPADPAKPLVLVGVPGAAEGIPADDIRDVLAELPDAAGFGVRLAPGDHRDLLLAGRLAAAALDAEVEVATAPPLLAGHGMRPRLVGTDGEPSWQPFVEAVVCEPPAPGGETAPRLLRWFPPVPGRGSAASGTVRLTDGWQVAVTRAGLWVGAADEPRAPLAGRPVDPDGVLIEVGTPGRALAPSLLPALSRLFATLDPDQWPRASLHLHGILPPMVSAALSQLAAHHGLHPAGLLRAAGPLPTAPGPAAPAGVRGAPVGPSGARSTTSPLPATASAAPARPTPPVPATTASGSATSTGRPTPAVPRATSSANSATPASTPTPSVPPASGGPASPATAPESRPAPAEAAAFGTLAGPSEPGAPPVPAPSATEVRSATVSGPRAPEVPTASGDGAPSRTATAAAGAVNGTGPTPQGNLDPAPAGSSTPPPRTPPDLITTPAAAPGPAAPAGATTSSGPASPPVTASS